MEDRDTSRHQVQFRHDIENVDTIVVFDGP